MARRSYHSVSRLRTLAITFLALVSLLATGIAPALANPVAQSQVIVNGQALSRAQLSQLGGQVPPGRYWYDTHTGAWGVRGSPTRGIIRAGLNLPGPMRADASNGNTGVFINGRNLPQQDLQALSRYLGRQISPGHYSLDTQKNLRRIKAPTRARKAKRRVQAPAPQRANGATGRQHFAGWNMSYGMPSGWFSRGERMRTQLLVARSGAGLILVHRGLARDVSTLEKGLSALARGAGVTLGKRQKMKIRNVRGLKKISATYSATDRFGRHYTLQLGAILSGKGTALVALGGAKPGTFRAVKRAVKKIVGSARVGAPQYHTRLSGTFVYSTGKSNVDPNYGGTMRSSDTFYTFDGRGNLRIKGNHMVTAQTGRTPGSGGGSGGSISHTNGRGTYKLLGKSVLVLTLKGRTSVHDIQIFSNGLKVDGRVYARQ